MTTQPFAVLTDDTAWIARNHATPSPKGDGRVVVHLPAGEVEAFTRMGRPWIRHMFADVPSDALNAKISCPVAFVAGS